MARLIFVCLWGTGFPVRFLLLAISGYRSLNPQPVLTSLYLILQMFVHPFSCMLKMIRGIRNTASILPAASYQKERALLLVRRFARGFAADFCTATLD